MALLSLAHSLPNEDRLQSLRMVTDGGLLNRGEEREMQRKKPL